MTELRALSARARKTALIVGAGFLLGATAALLSYVIKFGLDGFSAFALVIVALAAVLLGVGAPSRRPRRWGVVRIPVSVLCLFGFVIFMILGFPATDRHNATAGTLLYLAGLLLAPAAPCVAMLGRPGRDR